jgi:hypothetical protein
VGDNFTLLLTSGYSIVADLLRTTPFASGAMMDWKSPPNSVSIFNIHSCYQWKRNRQSQSEEKYVNPPILKVNNIKSN